MTLSPPVDVRSATPVGQRSLAPDLARGAMLLLIALAHAHMFICHEQTGFRGYAVDAEPFERLLTGAQVLLIDGRALPMFAALFGYGLARLADRQARTGAAWPETRRIVRRRSAWLLAFGFAHALLLFFGDILAAYGLVGLVFTGLLVARDRTLFKVAALVSLAHIGVLVLLGLSAEAADHRTEQPTTIADPLVALAMRLMTWSALTPTFYLVSILPAFVLGIWAARRRVLDEPGRHRRLLTRTALWGIVISLVGGAPLMLAETRLWEPETAAAVSAYALHSVTGLAAGLGYAALIALIAARQADRTPGPLTRALAACGARSLTCYLLQSVAFVAIFSPWAAGLGTQLSDAAASGIAVAVWAATVAIAAAMARTGTRGPCETLLRRLTYPRT
ncbi:DUF418 domain-containing protein [Glycomyces sp. YM15]|uniref:DUF418 domain-containing protein n=1 Tax=Glycomyces sp. YM15 TaxID=2800446 RepID=UPI00196542D4|nr:DUF418 domain-containing protein [Glycomyces sp. YM15]